MQHFNRRFFPHKMKPKPENVTWKYYDIIEAPQKHFYTMGKYISNDIFVSMTASRSNQS